ncbi:MAG: divalent-cation tolerance protein CutA, partial [Candidatus Aminicenantes bacterium]|nr:divalent-cation tolerance protein CutA [Candidatus Aminicenantes bacterium]
MTERAAFIVVFTTVPDKKTGERIAQALVKSRFAACASLSSPCESTYWWQGAVSREIEHTLIIKTTARLYPAVEQKIRELHPY